MEKTINAEEFKNPPSQYRGMPFWAWNTKLDPAMLPWQIQAFREMGMGGFYLHTRVGLDTEYLGTEFMDCVKLCAELAEKEGMNCGLYDEDRWPSGYGGGEVTKHREYRCKALLITPFRQGTKVYGPPAYDSRAAFCPQGNGQFMAAYWIKLKKNGSLNDYIRCEETAEKEGYSKWYVYLETAYDSPWFNDQSYVDTMNPDAIHCFLQTSYETYHRHLGNHFGKTIPSIFTDEPQFAPKGYLGDAFADQEIMLPFTGDFPETFQNTYGEDFFDRLPELIWELPEDGVSPFRYHFHDHVAERFYQAYGKQVGTWCREHGIGLAGHMMEEPTLQSQTKVLGEVMRNLSCFTLPGIDMLCDAREYTTAKQAASICHQYGKAGMVSELYGVTNWDFDFRRHKLQGDWQAALGVTHRVHHLSLMSMNGEAKRDYPASIGFQSPWFRKYKRIEDHFARVNVIMRKGRPEVKIAVIHPVESYWLCYGPGKQTGEKRRELDDRFQQVTEWLLFSTLDFDFLSESLIPDLWNHKKMGEMEYDAVLIPGCLTLRKTTLSALKEMAAQGKMILFMGDVPTYVDGEPSRQPETFAKSCLRIPFSRYELIRALEPYRLVDIRYFGEKHLKKPDHKKNWDGERAETYLYQLRKDGDCRYLFLANGKAMKNPDLVIPDRLEIKIAGNWNLEEYDTQTGQVKPIFSMCRENHTIFQCTMYEQDSLLLKLIPKEEIKANEENIENKKNKIQLKEEYILSERDCLEVRDLYQTPVEILREETNVALLDQPEYSFDGKIWKEKEDILRIDNNLRSLLGYPLRMAAQAQPWTIDQKEMAVHPLFLRYRFLCETDIKESFLALEELPFTEIFLDGIPVAKEESGYYTDPSIKKISLGTLLSGNHEILLKLSFTARTNVEACYLLGDFSVKRKGLGWSITAMMPEGGWYSLTDLGLPFYGGNAVYSTELLLDPGIYKVQVSKFRSPLISVKLDGETVGDIICSPYTLSFPIEETRKYRLEFVAYGNRNNTFGALHDCDEQEVYFDPNAWRTKDESWTYGYQLKPSGILKAPVLWKVLFK